MNRVSGVFRLTVTKDGDTLGGALFVRNGNLEQQKDKVSGAFIPDYTVEGNRPEIFPYITSSNQGGNITGIDKFTNVAWYFNSVKIEEGNPNFEFSTEGDPGSQVPSLILKGNPVDTEGSYEIRFEADINNGATISKIVLNTKLSLTESSTIAYSVILNTKYGGIINQTQSEVLTPYVRLGSEVVNSGLFFKYYKMVDGDWQPFPNASANNTSRSSITVTAADVDGIDLFKVDVHLGTATGDIKCSDAQEVVDTGDPYQIVANTSTFYYGSPTQTIKPKVYKGSEDVSASWIINEISLIFSDGTEKKESSTGSITLTFDEVKEDPGVPYLYVTASKKS